MIVQVREFKEAFGFFNSQNSRDTELTVDEIFDVIAKFETAQPGKEVLPKVRRSPSGPLSRRGAQGMRCRSRSHRLGRAGAAGGGGADPGGGHG